MKYLIATLLSLIVGSLAHADGIRNRITLPHTETKALKGVGTVTIKIYEKEAIDVVYVDTFITCLDKRFNYRVEMTKTYVDTTEICDYTGFEYDSREGKFVIGFNLLANIAGPSKCATNDPRSNHVDLRVMCAALQPR